MTLKFWGRGNKEESAGIKRAKSLEARVDELTKDAVSARGEAEFNMGRIMRELDKNNFGPMMRNSLEPRI